VSRSGYVDEMCDEWSLIRYRGAVKSAIRGKRGQAFLREMIDALDRLPEKRLIAGELRDSPGLVCAIGAVGEARGVDMAQLDPEDAQAVGGIFGIAEAMAREIVYENDEACWHSETPEQRFARMRRWAEQNLAKCATSDREHLKNPPAGNAEIPE
jgi:hypothetical protein